MLREVVYRLYPKGWSGSLATKLESRLTLLSQLDIEDVPAIAPAFEAARQELERRIGAERRAVMDEDGARSGRFE